MNAAPTHGEAVSMEFRPADRHRFGDVVEMLGPKRRPDALACWCLTYRLGAEATGLDAEARRDRVFEMCGHRPAPGILGYLDGEVVGWAGVAPRSEVAELRNTDTYPVVDGPGTDDAALWSIFCLRTKGRRRRRGIGQQLLAGAIAFARENGAEAVEGYPLDTDLSGAAVDVREGRIRRSGSRPGTTRWAPRVVMRLETGGTRQ